MKLKSIHLLVLLAMCWGPSFLFIKLALLQLDPVLLSVLRIGIGAAVLNIVLLLRGDYLPKDLKFWKASAVAAFFSVAFPFMLINWGQQFIDSSLGALLNGTTPFFTVIFSFLLLQSEPIPANKVRGIVLGFLGLIVLVYPNLLEGVNASLKGIIAIVLASTSYGVGWVWVKKHLTSTPSFKAPAAQLMIATLYLLPFTFFTGQESDLASLNLVTISSIVALGVLGTAIAFILYFRLIAQAGPSYASMVTYLVPVIGVVLGIIVLNETLTPWMLCGAGMILFGIYLGNKPKGEIPKENCADLGVLSKVR
ncbi:MAG: DMT family transporter [Cytophagales bacterium]|nr:DMT family transporter [Cytophagales bacterium]